MLVDTNCSNCTTNFRGTALNPYYPRGYSVIATPPPPQTPPNHHEILDSPLQLCDMYDIFVDLSGLCKFCSREILFKIMK